MPHKPNVYHIMVNNQVGRALSSLWESVVIPYIFSKHYPLHTSTLKNIAVTMQYNIK